MEQSVHFNHEINVNLPAARVWVELAQSFRDSTKSRVWPTSLSVLNSNALKQGTLVRAKYKFLVAGSNVEYRLRRVQKGRSLEYEATANHPLKGGGRIEVIPQGASKTLLTWKGEYRYDGFSVAAFFFKYYFEKRFFSRLKDGFTKMAQRPMAAPGVVHARR